MLTENKSSYRQIMKATSLFGGVQVFIILISIIRSKFIAVLLGPAGMGITGLLTSATGLISALTNFGLVTSGVKNVAAANGTGNQTRIAIIITVLQRWVWLTGLLGMVVTIIGAPFLSRLTFGNGEYTFQFIWISISVLFLQLCNGQLILLQGMRKLSFLAKANLVGSILGLVITVPLYYMIGVDGIVPSIIITALISFVTAWYFGKSIEIEKVRVSKVRIIAEGKEMLYMGFMISISGLITLGASYIVRIFINNTGGFEQVGLYSAGFAIINTYVGLIFGAMGTDYYPRLAAVAYSNELCRQTINQQAEIAMLILAPILMIFLVFIEWVVLILYSNKFVTVSSMIHWAALGMLFKAVSWAIGYILLAKGDTRVFFWNELIWNICMLVLNILGYHFLGLTGLGISFMVGYLLYLIQIYFVSKIKYQFSFDSAFKRIFVLQFSLAIGCFSIVKFTPSPYSYIVGILLIAMSSWFSIKELDRRLGLQEVFLNLKKRY